jgi:hypothetical protein
MQDAAARYIRFYECGRRKNFLNAFRSLARGAVDGAHLRIWLYFYLDEVGNRSNVGRKYVTERNVWLV